MKVLFQRILFTVLISSSVATPARTLRDARRTALAQPPINCTFAALLENPNTACWNQLDLSGYLDGWNKTTPTCSSDSDADCCREVEVWASCFLRLATGTQDLCGIGSLTDVKPCYTKYRALRPSLDPRITDQVGSVLLAIEYTNLFFIQYGKALLDSITNFVSGFILVSDFFGNIDTSGGTVLSLANVVDALDLGLSFLGSPSILPPSTLTNYTLLASHNLLTSLSSSPTVARAFFVPSTPSNTTLLAKDLGGEIGFQESPARLATALSLLMTDLSSFISFAANGSFSSYDFNLGLIDSQPHLNLALSTHIVSELLGQNDWFGVPVNVTSHADFAASCGAAALAIFGTNRTVCQSPAGEAIFWSPITHRIYALRYQGQKKNQKLSPIDMLKSVQNSEVEGRRLPHKPSDSIIVENNTVVDLPTLFDGAYNCTAQGRAGGSIIDVNEGGGSGGDGTGTLDMSCLSRLPIYLPCKTACPTSGLVGGKCPFGFTGKGC